MLGSSEREGLELGSRVTFKSYGPNIHVYTVQSCGPERERVQREGPELGSRERRSRVRVQRYGQELRSTERGSKRGSRVRV